MKYRVMLTTVTKDPDDPDAMDGFVTNGTNILDVASSTSQLPTNDNNVLREWIKSNNVAQPTIVFTAKERYKDSRNRNRRHNDNNYSTTRGLGTGNSGTSFSNPSHLGDMERDRRNNFGKQRADTILNADNNSYEG